MPAQQKLLTISSAATHLGVSSKTLRRWEDKGILKARRTKGGQRRYSFNQLTQHQNLKNTGSITTDTKIIHNNFVTEDTYSTLPPASSFFSKFISKIILTSIYIIIGFFLSNLINFISITKPAQTLQLAVNSNILPSRRLEEKYSAKKIVSQVVNSNTSANMSKDIPTHKFDTFNNIVSFKGYLYIQTYQPSTSSIYSDNNSLSNHFNINDPPNYQGDYLSLSDHPSPKTKQPDQDTDSNQLQSTGWISPFYGDNQFTPNFSLETGQSNLYLASSYMGSDHFKTVLSNHIQNDELAQEDNSIKNSNIKVKYISNCQVDLVISIIGNIDTHTTKSPKDIRDCEHNKSESETRALLKRPYIHTNNNNKNILGKQSHTGDIDIIDCAEINTCIIVISEASTSAQISFINKTGIEPTINIDPVLETTKDFNFKATATTLIITSEHTYTEPTEFYWSINNHQTMLEATTSASTTNKHE